MDHDPERNPDGEEALRLRLREVVSGTSQSRVARATNTPQASISRYLKDRRIPADFCARLTRALGVNPTWLLLGEGTPYLPDVAAEVQETGAQLLKLVEAINSANRMQIGSLLGNEHRRSLLELRQQVDLLENAKSELNGLVGPVFEQLIEEFDRWMRSHEWERANALLTTLEQLRRLSQDEDLLAHYEDSMAYYHLENGDLDTATRARRELFRRGLARPVSPAETQLLNDANFLTTLFRAYRLEEAHRVARILSIVHEGLEEEPYYWLIEFAVGQIEIDLGDLAAGLPRMLRAYPKLPERTATSWYGSLLVAQMLAGALTLETAVDLTARRMPDADPMQRVGLARTLGQWVIASEQLEPIQRLREAVGDFLEGKDAVARRNTDAHLHYLERALTEPSAELLVEYEADAVLQSAASADGVRSEWLHLVYSGQIARWVGDASAANRVAAAERLRRRWDSELTPWLALRAVHYRGVEAHPPSRAAAKAAEAFRERHSIAGYVFPSDSSAEGSARV
ncbi:MAG: helix-turn-helix domain-containing protein [Planctomycetota bacterium]